MLSSLLRSKRGRSRSDENPLLSTPQNKRVHARADWTEDESGDEVSEDEDATPIANQNRREGSDHEEEEEEEEDDEDEAEDTPLLPIFSAAHLG